MGRVKRVLNWFQVNALKANPIKSQFMILGDKEKTYFVFDIKGKVVQYQ